MKYSFIQEPVLEFGKSVEICPRRGISEYSAYDIKFKIRKRDIFVGAVGTGEGLDSFFKWTEKCTDFIPAKIKSKQPNLFQSFCGFNENSGFKANMIVDKELSRTLTNKDIDKLTEIKNWDTRITESVNLYFEQIKYLIEEKGVDIVTCIIPSKLESKITKRKVIQVDEGLDSEEEDIFETDFRRYLKAKVMHLGRPIQLVLQTSLELYKPKSGKQDDATKAWNYCTALYYKTNHIPWRLVKDPNKAVTCFVGISFYRSRDRKTVNTSLAQLFDDLGNGIILRGNPVEIDKNDRQPHLSEEQAFFLIKNVLDEYQQTIGNLPMRIVIQKTSNFSNSELTGFKNAVSTFNINSADYITILDSNIKLFRHGIYPVLRGSHIEIDYKNHLLMTRGSVEFYRTYPGMYVPRPLEIRIIESDENPKTICDEILCLTKMNWNNTQFDGRYPITIACARRVGEIMKYITENEVPQTRYSFYM